MDRMKRNQWLFTALSVLVMVVLLYVLKGPFRGEGSKAVPAGAVWRGTTEL